MTTEEVAAPHNYHLRGLTVNLHRLADEDLVQLAKRGSALAKERLIFLYGPLVRNISKRFFVLGAEKEDVIQEGFIGLIKAIRAFSTEDSNFRCFASLCITRQIQTAVRDACRSKHNGLNHAIAIEINECATDDLTPDDDRLESVSQLLSEFSAGLTDFEKSVLHELALGRSYSDIGKLLGCPPKSVDNGIQRAKRKIMMNRSE